MSSPEFRKRCAWCLKDDLYRDYHDHEWGIPVHDDRVLFEKLILEGFQSGLSWYTILKKRDHFRAAFDQFDPAKISLYGEAKVEELMQNPGIIRNQAKIRATIHNAARYFEIVEAFGSLDQYLWQFTGHKTLVNQPATLAEIPAITPESEAMSKDLRKRGFKFVGPTTCYALMQAMGMVNDHVVDCWKKKA